MHSSPSVVAPDNSALTFFSLAQIMKVSLANQWLSKFFDPSADYGLNSYTKENKFYQDMGFGCPFLIGIFVLTCLTSLLL